MKKKITILIAGIALPVFAMTAQDLPMTVVGNVKTATAGSMMSQSKLVVKESGILDNQGTLKLDKGVVFYSDDDNDGKLANSNVVNLAESARLIKKFQGGWYYISFPFDVDITSIRDLTTNEVLSKGSQFLLREYDAATRALTGAKDIWKETSQIKANVGYVFQISTPRKGHEIQFTSINNISTLYPGEKIIPLNYDFSSKPGLNFESFGWNLIGNSHTTSFLLNASTTEFRGTVQIYSRTGGWMAIDIADVAGESGVIAPFVALFMQTVSPGETFTLKKAGISVQAPLLRSSSIDGINILKLKISGDKNNYYDQTRIVLGTQFSSDFLVKEDGLKLFSPQESAPQIWSMSKDNKALVVNKTDLGAETSLPLSYSVGEAGHYIIDIVENAVHDYSNVWLEDKELGRKVDLLSTNYSFDANEKIDSPNRFVLHFAKSPTGINALPLESAVQIYASNSYCHVNGVNSGDVVMIYDIIGRLISSATAKGQEYISSSLSQGVYIIKVNGSVSATGKIKI